MYSNLEFRHLSYFVAVAEEGSFGKAAGRLHVSQPNLTTQIRNLEEAMDATLLIRGGQGTRISAAGSAFLPFARQLLQIREDAARETSAVHHGRTSSFRLGYSPFISQGLLREALRAYKELVPEGADGLSNDGSATLAKMVRDGSLDAALVTLPVAGRELLKQVICTERYLVCLRRDDPYGTEKSLSPASVSANLKIFVNRSQNPLFSDYVKRKLSSAGINPRAMHLVATPADMQLQVQAGNGWGLVHESLKLDPDLTRLKITGVPIRVRTAFISHKNQDRPLFPLLAFRIAATCERRPLDFKRAAAEVHTGEHIRLAS